uniref:Protein argonaute 16 n=1 Tax=Oryza sativa subsp. japonica TaxID=39947 RepID=AGO16_ORYSJ|nr:RecName: Full=Protein argonaute 16; Short=OsAGO16; AltName: Full=OsAGO6; AltName: Full=Protein ZWILLE/PINHEAD-like 1 [Oryza sativa Japonica Group]
MAAKIGEIVQVHNDNPVKRVPIARPSFGREGKQIKLLSNHFTVKLSGIDAVFYQYSVSIKSEDDKVIDGKGIGRKVMDKVLQTYSSELAGKEFAYDGEKCLFTVGPLPQNNFEFTVILEETSSRAAGGSLGHGSPNQGDKKRSKCTHLAKKIVVGISYAAKIPLKSVALALQGSESDHAQDALRVLDIVLRQQQAKRGCLLVRQSFFSDDFRNLVDLTGGVSGCRGLHSSFRTTIGGLSLNMDVSTTMIVTPGPVFDFLLTNQNVRDIRDIDWPRAKKMLKNLRVKAIHNNMEFKIIGLSDEPCSRQTFPMKVRNGSSEGETVEITVQEYFKSKQVDLTMPYLPCLDVGKPKRPNYVPIELCHMVSLQRYTKALSSQQRATLVEKSRQKPQERMRVVTDAVKNNRYDDDPILSSCGIKIEKQLTRVDGRVLSAPTLVVGNSEDCIPNRGRWNYNNKRLFEPVKIERWAIVNFSARCDMSRISRDLINCGRTKGIIIERPFTLVDEDSQSRRCTPVVRVESMFEKVKANLPGPPEFLLCVLPERKNCDLYGPWKKKNLHEMGIITQCIVPSVKMNDQYYTNVLLKINAKLGGMNSKLSLEHRHMIPIVNQTPTLILGMDVSHGSPGRADVPSIAAVVGSRCWPLISRYRASVRTQSPKVEMIDSLFKPLDDGKDDGIIRELLLDFYKTSQQRKPKQIIIFRDGVSESQFSQVLNVELNQIIKAYQYMDQGPIPKFTVIIAQKNHHTKLFQENTPDNVPPGTVVDSGIVHPRQYDFYMYAHAGPIGTSRPTHYHVLLDEIGFLPDDVQKLVLSLSYVYQRSTTAISVVAPICYAHLAAAQMGQFMKFEEFAETSSGSGGVPSSSGAVVPELPRLHADVCSSMFFC